MPGIILTSIDTGTGCRILLESSVAGGAGGLGAGGAGAAGGAADGNLL